MTSRVHGPPSRGWVAGFTAYVLGVRVQGLDFKVYVYGWAYCTWVEDIAPGGLMIPNPKPRSFLHLREMAKRDDFSPPLSNKSAPLPIFKIIPGNSWYCKVLCGGWLWCVVIRGGGGSLNPKQYHIE